MKPLVYVETTIPSYLAARPSRDLIIAANQQVVQGWWSDRRSEFELVISQYVLNEAGLGDPDLASRRLKILEGLPLLATSASCELLGVELVRRVPLPARAVTDALHVAVAALNGVDYLLTLNCTHLANATIRPRKELVCEAYGVAAPIICTPQELMEL